MTFKNEFVSEDDIKKFDLKKMWLGCHLNYEEYPEYLRMSWTRDHDQNAFLMFVGGGGREQPELLAAFYFKKNFYFVEVIKTFAKIDPNIDFESLGNGELIWKILSVDRKPPSIAQSEMIESLKKALISYGHLGVHKQLPGIKIIVVVESS